VHIDNINIRYLEVDVDVFTGRLYPRRCGGLRSESERGYEEELMRADVFLAEGRLSFPIGPP
jgi:hypothetical protein